MQKTIQNRGHLCQELAIARREAGLSQQALASKIGVTREKIARLESGSGSTVTLVKAMGVIPMRLIGVAKGADLPAQLVNCRRKRGWSEAQLSKRCGIDARTIRQIESGRGTVATLSAVLSALAPGWTRQTSAPTYWSYDKTKSAESDCRFTPADFLAQVELAFGPIDLDPCWHPQSNVLARRTISLPSCGLKANWGKSGLVFVNPPYSDLAGWVEKMNSEWERGSVHKMLLLLPASRLDLGAFFERTARHATTLIFRDRLRFERPDGRVYPSPFAMALACLGCEETELEAFVKLAPALVIRPKPLPLEPTRIRAHA